MGFRTCKNPRQRCPDSRSNSSTFPRGRYIAVTSFVAAFFFVLSLHIFFSDGTSQTVDFKPFILAHPHPQYNRYIEPKNFKKFTIEHGNVVWGKNWDMIFPIKDLYNFAL